MARKTSFDDALDYIFIANDKNPNTYVISSAAYPSAKAATTITTSSGYDVSSRITSTLSGTAALTAATITATSALFGNSNSNSFVSDSLITAAAAAASTSSSFSSPSTLLLPSAGDTNMFANVAIDLGSLLINDTLMNDTSLLADLVNISDPYSNGTASGNMTTPEDLGELIRMAATSVILGLMILITIIAHTLLKSLTRITLITVN